MPRLSFDVDDNFYRDFQQVVKTSGASSKVDAFRKAVAVYKVATDARTKGEKLMMKSSDREIISEIIIA